MEMYYGRDIHYDRYMAVDVLWQICCGHITAEILQQIYYGKNMIAAA